MIVSIARPRLHGYAYPAPVGLLSSFVADFTNPENPLRRAGAAQDVFVNGADQGTWHNLKTVLVGSTRIACQASNVPSGFTDGWAVANPALFNITPNQYVEATLFINPAGTQHADTEEVELLALWGYGANIARGYEWDISLSSHFAQFVRWNGAEGQFTDTAPFNASVSLPGLALGDTFRIETNVTGASVTVTAFYRPVGSGSFSQVVQVVDNSAQRWSTGMPGIGGLSRADPVTNLGWSSLRFGSL